MLHHILTQFQTKQYVTEIDTIFEKDAQLINLCIINKNIICRLNVELHEQIGLSMSEKNCNEQLDSTMVTNHRSL